MVASLSNTFKEAGYIRNVDAAGLGPESATDFAGESVFDGLQNSGGGLLDSIVDLIAMPRPEVDPHAESVQSNNAIMTFDQMHEALDGHPELQKDLQDIKNDIAEMAQGFESIEDFKNFLGHKDIGSVQNAVGANESHAEKSFAQINQKVEALQGKIDAKLNGADASAGLSGNQAWNLKSVAISAGMMMVPGGAAIDVARRVIGAVNEINQPVADANAKERGSGSYITHRRQSQDYNPRPKNSEEAKKQQMDSTRGGAGNSLDGQSQAGAGHGGLLSPAVDEGQMSLTSQSLQGCKISNIVNNDPTMKQCKNMAEETHEAADMLGWRRDNGVTVAQAMESGQEASRSFDDAVEKTLETGRIQNVFDLPA